MMAMMAWVRVDAGTRTAPQRQRLVMAVVARVRAEVGGGMARKRPRLVIAVVAQARAAVGGQRVRQPAKLVMVVVVRERAAVGGPIARRRRPTMERMTAAPLAGLGLVGWMMSSKLWRSGGSAVVRGAAPQLRAAHPRGPPKNIPIRASK